MNPYGIVILSKYPEYARNLIESIRKHSKYWQRIIVVRDGHEETFDDPGWYGDCFYVDAEKPFIYAKNANCGIKILVGDILPHDVILLNDDMEVVEDDFFAKLHQRAYEWERCGLISPLIDGGVGNSWQSFSRVRELRSSLSNIFGSQLTVCFPCVYIKRELIDKIGLLDETFTGYGFDDDDYCMRARAEGFWTMICSDLVIKHGAGGASLDRGKNWSCSFARESERHSNLQRFLEKYPHMKSAF